MGLMACLLARYPRLWSVGSLPEASTQLVPVRTGGVLVLAKHLILYHTQACPALSLQFPCACAES